MCGSYSFLIVAGGSGSRIGGLRKQFRALGGKPLWRWSAECAASLKDRGVGEIVLVFPADFYYPCDELDLGVPVKSVAGGASRAESVSNGLNACTYDFVMVHDAARPFASASLLQCLMQNTGPLIGAIPMMPVSEALKRRLNHESEVEAVERDGLFLTQTPQSFPRQKLIDVLGTCGTTVKDEAEAWLAAGLELKCIEGERLNFKVTWPEDLQLAESLISGAFETRTGLGYDVHRLVPERPLILGGIKLDLSPLGLLGHSDADILAHTIADALLGAAGLPDIGNLFPATDEKYKNADSMGLLKQAFELVHKEGWEVVWVDAVIEAQIPRLNDYLPEIKQKLSETISPSGRICVNLKAKSPEKTGDSGLGRSMVCSAVATLRRFKAGFLYD